MVPVNGRVSAVSSSLLWLALCGSSVDALLYKRMYSDLQSATPHRTSAAQTRTACAARCSTAGSDNCKMFVYTSGVCSEYSDIAGELSDQPTATAADPVHVQLYYTQEQPLECQSPWVISSDALSCYLYVSQEMLWPNARAHCQGLVPGADMATIRNVEDNTQLALSTTTSHIFIGLSLLPDQYLWPDGSTPSYTNWKGNYGSVILSRPYGAISSRAFDWGRRWLPINAIYTNPFICEHF